MKQLQTQVEQLELTIQHLDSQLQELRLQKDSQQLQLFAQDPMVRNLMYNWKCKIENGTFQIETGIQNIRDLLNIRNPPLSYLSPLSSSSDDISDTSSTIYSCKTYLSGTEFVMNFGQDQNKSLVSIMVNFFNQALQNRKKSTRVFPSKNLLLPSNLISTPTNLIHELVDVYFLCHNPYSPMLHEATFRQQFNMLQDPQEDLITLCICTFVCTKPCYHISYTPREIRNMADYFYSKARSILMDQFDDMEKRLENVIAVSFLVKYCHMTLKLAEFRQYATIAYQLCLDLRQVYFENPPPTTSTCFNEEMHALRDNPTDIFREERPETMSTDVNKELYRRHILFIVIVNRIMDYLTNGYISESCNHCPFWGHLPGESESTKKFIFGRNWLSRFYNHSFVQAFSVSNYSLYINWLQTLTFLRKKFKIFV